MNSGNEKKLENERGSKRSHSLENSLCKRLWTCRGGGGGYTRLTSHPRRLIFIVFRCEKREISYPRLSGTSTESSPSSGTGIFLVTGTYRTGSERI